MYDNYPNPVKHKSRIPVFIPETGHLRLVIYDVRGREVAALYQGTMNKGMYNIAFDLSRISDTRGITNGVFFIKGYFKMQSGELQFQTKPIVILK